MKTELLPLREKSSYLEFSWLVFSPNEAKHGPENGPNTDSFHAVSSFHISFQLLNELIKRSEMAECVTCFFFFRLENPMNQEKSWLQIWFNCIMNLDVNCLFNESIWNRLLMENFKFNTQHPWIYSRHFYQKHWYLRTLKHSFTFKVISP